MGKGIRAFMYGLFVLLLLLLYGRIPVGCFFLLSLLLELFVERAGDGGFFL
jgi:hypothetical protein